MVPRGAIALVFEEMEWAKKVVSGYQKNGPPMQKCMLGTMAAVHIVWISKQQLYDVKDMHVCPHYTLAAMEVEQLTLKAREHKIRVCEYDTHRNYLDKDVFIRVVNNLGGTWVEHEPRFSNKMEALRSIDMEAIGNKLFKDGQTEPLTILKTDRGNAVLNVGVCSQD